MIHNIQISRNFRGKHNMPKRDASLFQHSPEGFRTTNFLQGASSSRPARKRTYLCGTFFLRSQLGTSYQTDHRLVVLQHPRLFLLGRQ